MPAHAYIQGQSPHQVRQLCRARYGLATPSGLRGQHRPCMHILLSKIYMRVCLVLVLVLNSVCTADSELFICTSSATPGSYSPFTSAE